MATIGKSPRSVNRVKSEYTLTGPKTSRPGTPGALSTPANTRIPLSKSSVSPQTVYDRKTFLPRRKLMIGDAKSHLTRSSPSSKVHDIIHNDAPVKVNGCTCDPELLGSETSHPNCTFVNVCNEHKQGAFRWREYLWWLWTFVGRVALFLLASIVVFVTFGGALNGVYWLFGGRFKKGDSNEEMYAEEENMLYEEEDHEAGQLDRKLMQLNPSGNSLTETTHALSLLDILIMTLESFFGWIGTVLLPSE